MSRINHSWSSSKMAFLLLVIIGGFFLWSEHRTHIFGVLPYLILLLCPVMHIFMHKGHGDHDKDHQSSSNHGGEP